MKTKTKKRKSRKSNYLTPKKIYNKYGGTKKLKYVSISLRHPTRYITSRTLNGNNIRQRLVELCKKKELEEYDKLTQQIISDYWKNYRMNSNNTIDFFIHLERNYDTFSIKTKLCLERCLTQLQEEAIPESMSYLSDILRLKQKTSINL
jgi:hypothetical protein